MVSSVIYSLPAALFFFLRSCPPQRHFSSLQNNFSIFSPADHTPIFEYIELRQRISVPLHGLGNLRVMGPLFCVIFLFLIAACVLFSLLRFFLLSTRDAFDATLFTVHPRPAFVVGRLHVLFWITVVHGFPLFVDFPHLFVFDRWTPPLTPSCSNPLNRFTLSFFQVGGLFRLWMTFVELFFGEWPLRSLDLRVFSFFLLEGVFRNKPFFFLFSPIRENKKRFACSATELTLSELLFPRSSLALFSFRYGMGSCVVETSPRMCLPSGGDPREAVLPPLQSLRRHFVPFYGS